MVCQREVAACQKRIAGLAPEHHCVMPSILVACFAQATGARNSAFRRVGTFGCTVFYCRFLWVSLLGISPNEGRPILLCRSASRPKGPQEQGNRRGSSGYLHKGVHWLFVGGPVKTPMLRRNGQPRLMADAIQRQRDLRPVRAHHRGTNAMAFRWEARRSHRSHCKAGDKQHYTNQAQLQSQGSRTRRWQTQRQSNTSLPRSLACAALLFTG